MLVDHANAEPARGTGGGDLMGTAVDPDLTSIRTNQSIGNMHQGGLAGTVLP
jgi:hypothetical protein